MPNRDSIFDSSFFVTNRVRGIPDNYNKEKIEEKLPDKKHFSSLDLNVKKELPFIKIYQNDKLMYEKHDKRKKEIKNILDNLK